MIRSIPLVDVAARIASLRCVSRIDTDKRNSIMSGLVGNKGAKLGERPGVQPRSLPAPGRNPRANVPEFFQHDAARGAFRRCDDLLRDYVVRVFAKPGLLPGEFTEPALGGLGATTLKAGLTARESVSDALDFGSGVHLSVAIYGQGDDAEIHAEPIACPELLGLRNVARRGQEPFAAHQAEIDLSLAEGHQPPLMLAHHEGHDDPTLDRPKANGRPVLHEPQDAIIVGLPNYPLDKPRGAC